MLKRTLLSILCAGLLAGPLWADPVPIESGNTTYNCHGFTFHDAQTEGPQESTEQTIEDNYHEVNDPQVGDIIVYDGEAVSHTGLVVGHDADGNLLVVSKFGTTGDLKIHQPNEYGDSTTDADWQVFRPNGTTITPHRDYLDWFQTYLQAVKFNNADLKQRYGRRMARYLSHLQFATRAQLERQQTQANRGTMFRVAQGRQQQAVVLNPFAQPSYHGTACGY